MNQSANALTCRIDARPAGPVLLINGVPTPLTLLFVNAYDAASPTRTPKMMSEVETAGRHGVHLVSTTIGMPWQRSGERPAFEARAGQTIDSILHANPQALILPRIYVCGPEDWWVRQYPDDMMLYDTGQRGQPSIHSRIWRRDAARYLGELISYLENRYGAHILGYHPCGQATGEWFFDRMWEGRLSGYELPAIQAFRRYLTAEYGMDAALARAWNDPTASIATALPPSYDRRTESQRHAFRTDQQAIDFDRFQNEAMADAVVGLCEVIRQRAPHKLSVLFYGYHFEMALAPAGMQSSGHLALSRVLASPHVDVLCSPVSYYDRAPGGGGYYMAPVDSVHLHNKLWLVEDDTRTHFSAEDSGYGRARTMRETQGVLARNFGQIAVRGNGVWWMDLPGEGWFTGDELWSFLSTLQRDYADTMPTQSPYSPEIAVIVDEQSALYGAANAYVTGPLLYLFRSQWYRIGAPVGIYLLSDLLQGLVPNSRFYIMLNTWSVSSSDMARIHRESRKHRNLALWMYAPGATGSDDLTRRIREATGITTSVMTSTAAACVTTHGERFAVHDSPFTRDTAPLAEPALHATDPRAEVMATYAETGQAAVVVKKMGTHISAWSGVPWLPTALLREMARMAGVHIYNTQNDIIAGNSSWISLHATETGERRLYMPRRTSLFDCSTRQVLPPAKEFTFAMQKGDTKLLRIGATRHRASDKLD